MRVFLAFLIKSGWVHGERWNRWLENGTHDYQLGFHAWDKPALDIADRCVPTVKTTWEQTLPAHRELSKRALELDCDSFILLSESCLPCMPIAKFESGFDAGQSYFNFHPDRNDKKIQHLYRARRWADWAKPFILLGEQWYIVNRKHMELLYEDSLSENGMFSAHRKTFADNESWAISCLNWKGLTRELINKPTTFTWWKGENRYGNQIPNNLNPFDGKHPGIFEKVSPQLLTQIKRKGSWFARKFPAGFKGGLY